MRLPAFLLWTAVLAAGFVSVAASGGKPSQQKCRKEIKALCGDDANPDKIRQCVQAQKSKLSAECRNPPAHENHGGKQGMDGAPEPPPPPAECKKDFEAHCGKLAPGPEHFECVQAHREKMSDSCRRALEKAERVGMP